MAAKPTLSKSQAGQDKRLAQLVHWCLNGQEILAFEDIQQEPFDGAFKEIHQTLARHFATRQKLKLSSPLDRKAISLYKKHPDFVSCHEITAVILVKNEAANIKRCLQSLKSEVSEIVLVDSGCTDDTLKIAESLKLKNLRVLPFTWCDDFSAARNAGKKIATGDWILWIDADEELSHAAIPAFRDAITKPHLGGFSFEIRNFTEENDVSSFYLHRAVRLFRNIPEAHFTNRIHEQIWPSFAKLGYKGGTIGGNDDGSTILHYGYRPSAMSANKKADRNIRLLEFVVKEDPKDGFQWFNLANSYATAGMYSKQIYAAKIAIRLLNRKSAYLAGCYELLSSAYTLSGDPYKALMTIESAHRRGIENIFLDFEQALAYMRAGNLDEALAANTIAQNRTWDDSNMGDKSVITYKRDCQRSEILNKMGRYADAELYAGRAYDQCPTYVPTLCQLGYACLHQHKYEASLTIYDEAQRLCPKQDVQLLAEILAARGCCFYSIGRVSESSLAYEESWLLVPNEFWAWANWAESCEKSGDGELVTRAFEAFLSSEPSDVGLLINWGRIMERVGRSQKALECFVTAIQLDPTNANALYNCGDLLYKVGQFHDAAHIYQAALRLDPLNVEGWFVLGNSLFMLEINDGALIAFEKALELRPDHEGALHNLSMLREEADEMLEEAA